MRRLRATHEQGFLVEAERGLAEVFVEQGKVDDADKRTDDAEAAFLAALEIIEPTMYEILAREIRRSLESLRATHDTRRADLTQR